MFVKISHSLTGSLIIFDCALLATLSVHISLSLVWQMRPIVDFLFLPCHQSSGQHCWHWEWLEEKKKGGGAVTGLNKQSQHDQSCWVEENTVYDDWRGAGGGHCCETDHLNAKFLWHCSSWDGIGGLQLQTINHNYHTNVKQWLCSLLCNFTASQSVMIIKQ